MAGEQPTMNVRDLIGKRALVRLSNRERGFYTNETPDEMRFVEVSPSGNWTKLRNMNGRQFWVPTGNIALIEVLIDLRAEREPKP